MTIQDIIDFYGSGINAANAIGVTRQAVYQWRSSGSVPIGRQYEYESKTDGALKVTRSSVRNK